MKFAMAWDGLEKDRSDASVLLNEDEVITIQSGLEDADINVLVRRFGVTGEMPAPRASAARYGDFSAVGDYQSALQAVLDADEAFMSLPAELRKRFDNDPSQLLLFVQDDSNLDEARRLGLLEPEVPVPPPMRVEVVPPAAVSA